MCLRMDIITARDILVAVMVGSLQFVLFLPQKVMIIIVSGVSLCEPVLLSNLLLIIYPSFVELSINVMLQETTN
jgi:hypothetical protein